MLFIKGIGALAGVSAAALGIISNAPGTASQIPGALAPFAFNPPLKVCAALVLAAIGGTIGGLVVSFIMEKIGYVPAGQTAEQAAKRKQPAAQPAK